MKYSSWDMELDRIFPVILGHFLPFYPPTPYQLRKPKFWKNETSIWRCHPFKLVQQKIRSYNVYLLRHAVRQIKFFVIQIIFCSFTLLRTSKLKFGKNGKNTWRYHSFAHVYHKSGSYDVSLLKYKVQRTEILLSFWVIFVLWPS